MSQREIFTYRWQQYPFGEWYLFSVQASSQEEANILAQAEFDKIVNKGLTVMREFYPVSSKYQTKSSMGIPPLLVIVAIVAGIQGFFFPGAELFGKPLVIIVAGALFILFLLQMNATQARSHQEFNYAVGVYIGCILIAYALSWSFGRLLLTFFI